MADIGCGHGVSTITMAEAFPASRFVGFDYHDASIAVARKAVTARIRNSLKRIQARHPELGAHLAETITTGTSCSYTPLQSVEWTL